MTKHDYECSDCGAAKYSSSTFEGSMFYHGGMSCAECGSRFFSMVPPPAKIRKLTLKERLTGRIVEASHA